MNKSDKIWQSVERQIDIFNSLKITELVDYDKFFTYSIIAHSTAIEGSTITELEAQLLKEEI